MDDVPLCFELEEGWRDEIGKRTYWTVYLPEFDACVAGSLRDGQGIDLFIADFAKLFVGYGIWHDGEQWMRPVSDEDVILTSTNEDTMKAPKKTPAKTRAPKREPKPKPVKAAPAKALLVDTAGKPAKVGRGRKPLPTFLEAATGAPIDDGPLTIRTRLPEGVWRALNTGEIVDYAKRDDTPAPDPSTPVRVDVGDAKLIHLHLLEAQMRIARCLDLLEQGGVETRNAPVHPVPEVVGTFRGIPVVADRVLGHPLPPPPEPTPDLDDMTGI